MSLIQGTTYQFSGDDHGVRKFNAVVREVEGRKGDKFYTFGIFPEDGLLDVASFYVNDIEQLRPIYEALKAKFEPKEAEPDVNTDVIHYNWGWHDAKDDIANGRKLRVPGTELGNLPLFDPQYIAGYKAYVEWAGEFVEESEVPL